MHINKLHIFKRRGEGGEQNTKETKDKRKENNKNKKGQTGDKVGGGDGLLPSYL